MILALHSIFPSKKKWANMPKLRSIFTLAHSEYS